MKKYLLLIVMLMLVFCLAACGGTDEPVEQPQDPGTSTGEETDNVESGESLLGTEPVTITFWHCASDEAGVLMDQYIQDFNETNPYDITVDAVYQGQYSDATTLLNTILSAENYEELPDVMQIDATGKVAYYDSGVAFTVDDAVAAYADDTFLAQYLEAALGNWQYSGVQLGLPFATSTSVTYYNADLLAQAGWDKAPETFAEVSALYGDMQAAGMTQKVFQNVPNTPSLANWLGQLGSYVVDNNNGADGTASKLECIDNGALATFLTEWKAMYTSGALLNEQASADAFIAGDVVMMVGSSSSVTSNLERIGDTFEMGVSNYLRVNDEAAQGATVSGSCLVMFDSQDALKKEASWAFLQYLTSADVQADFAAGTGYVPSNTASVDSESYQTLLAEYPQYQIAMDQLLATPADMRSVTVGPSTDFYYAIMQCCSDMLEYDQTVEETVETMNDELTLLLEEYIRNNPGDAE